MSRNLPLTGTLPAPRNYPDDIRRRRVRRVIDKPTKLDSPTEHWPRQCGDRRDVEHDAALRFYGGEPENGGMNGSGETVEVKDLAMMLAEPSL